MDWSRAKTILIISFTLLNALLGYQLWVSWNEQSRSTVVSSQTVEELDQLLAAEHIKLEDVLLMDLPKMGYLEVQVTQMDEDWKPLAPIIELPRGDKKEEEVTALLQPLIEHLNDYRLDEVALRDNRWVYHQMDRDFPIFVAPIELKRDGNKLTGYRRTDVTVTSREQMSVVVPAHLALKAAVEAQLIPAGSTIEEVQLGYTGQLNRQEPQFLVPVWRIVAKGSEPLYVNALTGGIEAERQPLES